jgi:TonB-dependent SusC/RagA subfamily outer membrane receptor
MENNHDIDKKFNEASAKALDEPETFPSFEKVWDKIEGKLDKRDSKKRRLPIWMPYGIAASLVICFGIIYFIKEEKSNNPQKIDSVIAKNRASHKNDLTSASEHIQEIDKTIKFNIKKQITTSEPVKSLAVEITPVELGTAKVDDQPIYDVVAKGYLQTPAIQKWDTLRENNIEEVIAMGIKREKKSILNSSFRVSSNDGSPTNINSVEDTAQSITIDSFDNREPMTILGYNKNLSKNKSLSNRNILADNVSKKTLANSIGGLTPGLSVNSISANQGSGATVYIRGNRSIKDAEPLYIINGTVADSITFKNLDPNKIVAVTVLKDAAVTALYGSKASNGVIVVETKDISKSEKKKLDGIMKKRSSEKQPKP